MKKLVALALLITASICCTATEMSCLKDNRCFDTTVINKQLRSGTLFTQCTQTLHQLKLENPTLNIDEKNYCLDFDYRILSEKIIQDISCHTNYLISFPDFSSRPYNIKSEIRALDVLKISDQEILKGMMKFNPKVSQQTYKTALVACYKVN